ncbi:hypothetical protein HC362_32505 [Streptomyces sp. 891-h]|nr:hypothetical protein HC362_32505 [Streptomyces sp. 891-h]
MTNVAVVHYSSTGNVHTMARAAAQAAEKAGPDEVRLLKVAELAPAAAIEAGPAWARHAAATAPIPGATPADLEWANLAAVEFQARRAVEIAPAPRRGSKAA